MNDFRYALRRFTASPGITAIAVLSLGLGIGANTTIFSAVDALVLRPLPYDYADRLVWLSNTYPGRGWGWSLSYPDIADWRRQNTVFEGIGAYDVDSYNLSGGDRPERLRGARISANVLPLLRVEPMLGRGFLPEEDRPGAAERVVVLSYGLWQSRFGSDPGILGAVVTLSGLPHTVIGVMPEDFAFLGSDVDLLTPTRVDETVWSRASGGMSAFGRLKPGVSFEAAQAELSGIARRLEQAYPATNTGRGVSLRPLAQVLYGGGEARRILWLLAGAVGFVLLIACANVTNLLLARATTRRREIAVRAAIGAGRGRIVRQLLAESVLLALVGGALGCLIALWGTDLLTAALPEGFIAASGGLRVNARALGFTVGLSLLTGLAFGLAPAIHASRTDVAALLHDGGRGATAGPRRGRLRSLLVIGEVALALVLLVSAGLVLRSLTGLLAADPGFDARNLLTLRVSLDAHYEEARQVIAFQRQALERIEALPGVRGAAAVSTLPFGGTNNYNDFRIAGRPAPAPGEALNAGHVVVTPGYFRAMGIPLLRGRALAASDERGGPGVVVINEAMVRRFWPGEDPLGQRLVAVYEDGEAPYWRTVIGVVDDVRHRGLDEEPRPEMYVPFAQHLHRWREMTFVVRTAADPAAAVAPVREAFRAVDPNQPVYDARTMTRRIRESSFVLASRILATALGIFAGVALLLATVGLYGVVSYTVAGRTHEIGIRAALGARRRVLLGQVIREGMTLVALGLGIGLLGALALSRLLRGLLYDVDPADPATFAGVALLLAGVALLASYIPARRAARVDPMVALRSE